MIATRGYGEQQHIITRGLGSVAPMVVERPYLPYLPMQIPLPTAFVPFPSATMPVPIETELEPEQVEALLTILRDGDEFLILLN